LLLEKEQLALLIAIRRRLTAQGNGQAALDQVPRACAKMAAR
jgi:hypothetical protein